MTVGAAESWSSRSSGDIGARSWDSPVAEGVRRVERVIDRVLGELGEHRAHRLNLLKNVIDRGEGVINACGDESPAPWAVTYVRRTDQAVMPLAVGSYRHVIELADMLTDLDLTDESRWTPPRLLLDGAPRYFQPTYGRYLLGMARSGERVVMLVAIGEQLGVLLLDPGMARPSVLFIGSTLGLRDLDVDQLALLCQPSPASQPKSARKRPLVAAATQVHHRRIALGEEFETGDGPGVSEVVQLCFEALADRTIDAARRCAEVRARGVTFVRQTLRAIYLLGLRGSLDPCGLIGELHRQLSEADPSFRLRTSQLGNAIKLLERTECCLVMRMSRRIWKIRVVGLSDPRSEIHRQLCKETGGRFLFRQAANSGPERAVAGSRFPFGSSTARGRAEVRGPRGPFGATPATTVGDPAAAGDNRVPMSEVYKQVAVLTSERDELRRECERGRRERDELRVQLSLREAMPSRRSATWSGGRDISQRLEPKSERGEERLGGRELPRSEVARGQPLRDEGSQGERVMSEVSADVGEEGKDGGPYDADEGQGERTMFAVPTRPSEQGLGGQDDTEASRHGEGAVFKASVGQGTHGHGGGLYDAEERLPPSELAARLERAIDGVTLSISEVKDSAVEVGALRSQVADTRALVAKICAARGLNGGRQEDGSTGHCGAAKAVSGPSRERSSPGAKLGGQGPPELRIRPFAIVSADVVRAIFGEPSCSAED